MIVQGYTLSPLIEIILKQEINFNNKIVEIDKWDPNKEHVFIMLEKPFKKKYHIEGLKYLNVNDPHYWKEEYQDPNFQQTIACKF
ncbi:MAG: hypothetical protein JXR05_03880 [Flavobacteriaceae bacterium]